MTQQKKNAPKRDNKGHFVSSKSSSTIPPATSKGEPTGVKVKTIGIGIDRWLVLKTLDCLYRPVLKKAFYRGMLTGAIIISGLATIALAVEHFFFK